MTEYPALRVSAYDGTEKKENTRVGEPIQGQHIGISESTYHALKKKIELVNKYDLAGVAVWRWGFEDDKAFSTIDGTMNIQ